MKRKIDQSDLNEIKRLYLEEGKNFEEIANIFGCCRSTIARNLKTILPDITYSHTEFKVGDKFGKDNSVIVEILPKRRSSYGTMRQWYKISCSICGSITDVSRQNLIKPKRKMCNGCRKAGNQHFKWEGCGEISQSVFHSYEIGAKKRNIAFNTSIEEIWGLFLRQDRKCALTGCDIHFDPKVAFSKQNITASLDRIDSAEGYYLGNLQWIHRKIQFMKQDFQEGYFIELCKDIQNFQSNKQLYPANKEVLVLRKFHKCWEGYGNIHLYIWNAWHRGAKQRNLSWDINIEDGWDLFVKQGGLCAISGLPIDFYLKMKDIKNKTASLDRIDSNKGYTIDNIQWVHKHINLMKWDMSDTDLIKWACLVANYN